MSAEKEDDFTYDNNWWIDLCKLNESVRETLLEKQSQGLLNEITIMPQSGDIHYAKQWFIVWYNGYNFGFYIINSGREINYIRVRVVFRNEIDCLRLDSWCTDRSKLRISKIFSLVELVDQLKMLGTILRENQGEIRRLVRNPIDLEDGLGKQCVLAKPIYWLIHDKLAGRGNMGLYYFMAILLCFLIYKIF
ncbi:MAG: hypothetical protein Harvfovirus32_7 [Harvfovirus sp.]|uniref:Uncharacterized protein n=1 Tax=Harvfovirus sp. TaxID=2487768 RepID=A0A3G5A5A1_9VIRU|nr:MAG: hypothetical protein Harvfovirus32_7 [Harvfovirus sp.]